MCGTALESQLADGCVVDLSLFASDHSLIPLMNSLQLINTCFCPPDNTTQGCQTCNVSFTKGRPVGKDFKEYISWFLQDNPTAVCSKGYVLVAIFMMQLVCLVALEEQRRI